MPAAPSNIFPLVKDLDTSQSGARHHEAVLIARALTKGLVGRRIQREERVEEIVRLARFMAERMGFSDLDQAIELGALLHDVGMSALPDEAVRLGRTSSVLAQVELRRHVELGIDIVLGTTLLQPALPIVASHHERWDGGGYPQGLRENEIPFVARLFSVCEFVVEAGPLWAEEGRDHLSSLSGRQFDPAIVLSFLAVTKSEWRELEQDRRAA